METILKLLLPMTGLLCDIQSFIMCTRASSVVACLTLSSKLPLCRYVYLSLQWNVVSLVVHSVCGIDSSTSEEVEYLELACYQRDTVPSSLQTAVKQYHVPLSSVAAPSRIENGTENSFRVDHSHAEVVSGAPAAKSPEAAPIARAPSADSTSPTPPSTGNIVSAILAPSAAVVAGSFPDFALKKTAIVTSTSPNVSHASKVSAGVPSSIPTDGDIGTRSKDILLNALRARPAPEPVPPPAMLPKHKMESQKSAEMTSETAKAIKTVKTKRSSSETSATPALDMVGVDRDWENASLSASARYDEESALAPRLQHLQSSMINVEQILKDLQKAAARTAKHAVDQRDANEAWQRALGTELATALRAELVAETVCAVKAELSREFRESFERTLVPAFQRGVAEAFTQLQDEVSASVMRLNKDLQRVAQMKAEENRELCKQIQELRKEVQSLTSIVEASGLRSRSQSLAESRACGGDPLALLAEVSNIILIDMCYLLLYRGDVAMRLNWPWS